MEVHQTTQSKKRDPADCQPDEVKDITEIVGSFRKWQIWIFVSTIYFELVSTSISGATLFLVPGNLDYWCKNSDVYNSTTPIYGTTSDKEGICWYHENGTKTDCTEWEYGRKTYYSSIVEKWNLVCDKDWLVSFSMTVNIFGDLIGCIVFGILADRVGRRTAMLAALVPGLIGSIGTFFAPEIVTFLFCRFLCGAAGFGFLTCSYVLIMEVVGPSVRSAVGNFIKIGLTVGGILLGVTGYFFRYWQLIQLASTLPLVLMVLITWLLPESPRWLIMHNRIEEAEKVLLSAAKMNQVEVCTVKPKLEMLVEYLEKENTLTKTNRVTFWDLLKTRNVRIKSILMLINWLIAGFVTHSLLMNLTVFGKDNYWGPGFVMCSELLSVCLAHFIFKRYGCKWVNQLSWTALVAITFGIAFTKNSGYWPLMCYMAIMKMFTATASNGLYLQSAEIFPTVARTIGLGTCSSFARISAMASPFLKEMYQREGIFAPFVLLSGLCLIASILSIFLPNTHRKPLPETLEDAENVPLCTFSVCKFSVIPEEKESLELSQVGIAQSSMLDHKKYESTS